MQSSTHIVNQSTDKTGGGGGSQTFAIKIPFMAISGASITHLIQIIRSDKKICGNTQKINCQVDSGVLIQPVKLI